MSSHLTANDPTTARVSAGLWAPCWGGAGGAPALLGLLAFEHAYVQVGQAVPLA